MSPDDDLAPLPPTDLPPEEEQRHVQQGTYVDLSGMADAAGAVVEGVAHMGHAAANGLAAVGDVVSEGGEVVGQVAGAAGEAAGAAGEALGAVAEGASGCSCSVVVLLAVCLSAGSALAVSFLR